MYLRKTPACWKQTKKNLLSSVYFRRVMPILYTDGITDSTDMSLSKLRKLVLDREAWLAVGHGIAKSWK